MSSKRAPGSLYPEQTVRVIVPAAVPAIYTNRLYLRPLVMEDAADLFEFRSRQDVADYLWPKVPHKEIQETEHMIATRAFSTPDASGATGRKFTFAVIGKEDPSGKVIGAVGVNSLAPSPAVGYGIHPDFWGKGYVTEALSAVIDAWWKLDRKDLETADLELPPERLFAACNKANVGSVKVLLKTGFEIYEEIPLEGDIVALFEQRRPQN